ncbi:MAG: VCBS repeat-containing protein [Candidatus Cloacimonetes bacterium]|nr:VCBS repeat-containing protein [Candidatus Cloacimonadota bacterium]MBL7085644.1 VCBS repeat-containing protein [Candidatus Cloacimonadota bacterium]
MQNKTKMIVLLIICLTILCSIYLKADNKFSFKKISEDFLLSNSHNFSHFNGGELIDNQYCVTLLTSSNDMDSLIIFKIVNDSLKSIYKKTFSHRRKVFFPKPYKCMIADFNGDNVDEIIICKEKELVIIEWNGNKFSSKNIQFPYYIYDCVSGDITNDGKYEIVFACLDEIFDISKPPYAKKYNIIIARIKKNDIDIIHSQISGINIGAHRGGPPTPKFMCIADLHNTGKNELILPAARSDVSPLYLTSYKWLPSQNALKLNSNFEITNRKINEKRLDYKNISSYIYSVFNKCIISGKTYFCAEEHKINNSMEYIPVLFSLENDKIKFFDIDIKTKWIRSINIFHRKCLDSNKSAMMVFFQKRINYRKRGLAYQYYNVLHH